MKEIKLLIPYRADREHIISGLTNSGYKVWVVHDLGHGKPKSYLHIEIPEEKEKDK